MPGFNSPSILFLNTWDASERTYCAGLLSQLARHGYTRYEEPAVGGFAMPIVAMANGWKPEQMTTSDTHLYTAVLGELLAGRGMDALEARWNGTLIVTPTAPPSHQAAEVIWAQYIARTEPRTNTYYYAQLLDSMKAARAEYLGELEAQLVTLARRIGGLSFKAESLWEHMDRVADDPHAVIISNPPTYPGAYEEFFDTKGAVTWAAPDYDVFDAPKDIPRMVEFMEGRKALLVVQQQQTPGNSAHPEPPYARQLSAGQLVYINSNRPEEVERLVGGKRVVNRRMPQHARRPLPVLPDDYEIRPDSVIETLAVDGKTAEAYRSQWMHRISSAPGSGNVLMKIDGYAAGVIGYSTDSIMNSYSKKWDHHLILRFAFGSPHQSLRMTRLATMVALMRDTAWKIATPKSSLAVGASLGLVTVEMTRHPEAKGLRQLMTLEDRQSHQDGYKLVYASNWTEDVSLEETLKSFMEAETKWQRARVTSR